MHHFSATTGRRRTRAAIVALGSLTLLGVCPASQADTHTLDQTSH